jgi:alpha-tubulin suppressor-like RCC1 family protein
MEKGIMNRLSKLVFVLFFAGCFSLQSTAATFTSITAGMRHTCGLTSAGGMECWGYNGHGELGNGTTTGSMIPVEVTGLNGSVTAIAAGYGHTCVVTNAGGVTCWGYNADGELGNGTTTNSSTPVSVAGLSSGITAIATNYLHTCALTSVGGVACWGYNNAGQLGNGTTTDSDTPVDVTGLSGEGMAISTGAYHTCVLVSTGEVQCWGYNGHGELGNGTTTDSYTPVNVTGLGGGVKALAVAEHTCVLTTAGGVKCWGYNSDGELGNGTTIDSMIPVDVTGLGSGVSAIAVGYSHSCAVMDVGGVKCWGANLFGQLGNGTTSFNPATVPVNVTGLDGDATAIIAGGSHTCALIGDGEAECWGDNNNGQLGNGTYPSSSIPTIVLTLQTINVTTAAPSSAAYNSSFTVAATASSGLPVSFTTSGGCSSSGSGSGSATITMTSSTSPCTVYYYQTGNVVYAGQQVSSTTAATQAAQTITVMTAAPSAAMYGSSFSLGANSSSGLFVAITASGGCSGGSAYSHATITMSSGSTDCNVIYNQSGNANFLAASQMISITVATKAAQHITATIAAPDSSGYSTSFPVAAVSSSHLTTSITSSGGCSGSGSDSATITMNSGTTDCSVYYNQSGNDNYAAASQVTSTTTATRASQTITVTIPAPITAKINASFNVAATATSGLPVSITTMDGCTGGGSDSATITMTGTSTDCVIFYDQAGDGVNYDAAPELAFLVSLPKTVSHDYDGDGKADVLFLNTTTGSAKYWQDAAKTQSIYIGTYNLAYSYQGSGDFDGDGKADLLFVNTSTNATLIWSGAVKTAATYPGAGAAGYNVAAICDTDGDGKDDIVWFNPTTGSTRIWPAAVKAAVTYPGIQNTAYSIAACADFDGDKHADIFWRNNTNGSNQVWLGGSKSNLMYPGANTDLTAQAVGAGDTDGDGQADMVWYTPSTGTIRVWLGGVKAASTYMGTGATGFTPKAMADYDGDGMADLLWANDTTLATQIWLAFNKSNVTYSGAYPTGFSIQK